MESLGNDRYRSPNSRVRWRDPTSKTAPRHRSRTSDDGSYSSVVTSMSSSGTYSDSGSNSSGNVGAHGVKRKRNRRSSPRRGKHLHGHHTPRGTHGGVGGAHEKARQEETDVASRKSTTATASTLQGDPLSKLLDESKCQQQFGRLKKQLWLEQKWEQQLEEEKRAQESERLKSKFYQESNRQQMWSSLLKQRDEQSQRQQQLQVERELAGNHWRQKAEDREIMRRKEEERWLQQRQRQIEAELIKSRSIQRQLAPWPNAGRIDNNGSQPRRPGTRSVEAGQSSGAKGSVVSTEGSVATSSQPNKLSKPDYRRRHVLQRTTNPAEPWSCRAWGG